MLPVSVVQSRVHENIGVFYHLKRYEQNSSFPAESSQYQIPDPNPKPNPNPNPKLKPNPNPTLETSNSVYIISSSK